MAIKFEKINPGMHLYDRRRSASFMGGIDQWTVVVISVNREAGTAEVNWNSNKATTWGRRELEKLFSWDMRSSDAITTKNHFGRITSARKMTQKEMREHNNKIAAESMAKFKKE